ncbi:ImmA/IrrE family metallo-endopeptidase [Corynebacterium belfantii]|uniref:ImmA/IrrE family metallo-endopeptidase n=1 Tax=Corynebacterium belfantii TaxID=2014537 RepID=UPI0018D33248|nr:ImmA/IrrE family metallo-endopeptidase [Corynebacterium belfantii]MBG9259871.1 ImmA/IrrE family metallo-endopeptidase [Corynebacterium belfantii]MBG9266659.1 ImmA/IrrE family metallo-endopeptidase [Corynebacterium belfantii]MBG9330144.1 ImmA/IrrE family metallo-endopeptidase [Corynebacterium belfantii]
MRTEGQTAEARRLSSEQVAEIRARAEKAAGDVLDAFWNLDQYPVDPIAIAQEYGAEVYLTDLPDDFEGYFRPAKLAGSNYPQIWVDTDRSVQRQRFSLAHELGHLVEDGEKAQVDRRRNTVSSQGTDPHEIYANAFAAELLMPSFAVRQLFHAGGDARFLATYFNVSGIAMENRLKNLGLVR